MSQNDPQTTEKFQNLEEVVTTDTELISLTSEDIENASVQNTQPNKQSTIKTLEEFSKLDKQEKLKNFKYVSQELQEQIVQNTLTTQDYQIVEELLFTIEPPHSLYLLQQFTKESIRILFSPKFVEYLDESLKFPSESVGDISTIKYIAVRPDWTIDRVWKYIQSKKNQELDTTTSVFVTTDAWNFLGTLTLPDIIKAEKTDIVADIMRKDTVSISAYEDRENTVMIMQFYKLLDIPVVDRKRRLVAIVTMKNAMNVQILEATEDIQMSVQVSFPGGYLKTNIFIMYLKRAFWMVVLMLMGLLSSTVISVFEETLERTIELAMFLPVLIGTGGNTGAQASTLMIRGITTKEVTRKTVLKILLKEAAVTFMIAVTLSACMIPMSWLFSGYRWNIAVIVVITLFFVVFVANGTGSILPLILSTIRLDPAVATGPLVTTVLDVVGLLIYFGFATLIIDAIGWKA